MWEHRHAPVTIKLKIGPKDVVPFKTYCGLFKKKTFKDKTPAAVDPPFLSFPFFKVVFLKSPSAPEFPPGSSCSSVF